jgi:hypothetical protein
MIPTGAHQVTSALKSMLSRSKPSTAAGAAGNRSPEEPASHTCDRIDDVSDLIGDKLALQSLLEAVWEYRNDPMSCNMSGRNAIVKAACHWAPQQEFPEQ